MKTKPKLLHPLDWGSQSGAGNEIAREIRRRASARRRRRALGAAACLLGVAAVFWLIPRDGAAPAPTSAVVSVPARRTLADGSTVELRPGADYTDDYSASFRRVTLRSGAAHFTVAKDPARPFVVTASGVDFRAVGTAFSVQIDDRQVGLVVTEGIVAVATPSPAANLVLVSAGNRVILDTAQPAPVQPAALSEQEIGQLLAWRVPRLEFSQTPLSEVIAMINAHSRTRLRLQDDTLADVRISGMLRADNLDTLFRLLADEHRIGTERQAGGEILLRR